MKNNITFAAITITAIFLAGFVAIGQIDKVFSQTNESRNITAMSSNASSMQANITGSNANDTGMGAPHASNMTAEKVLAPNGTAPS
jgi:predicted permease